MAYRAWDCIFCHEHSTSVPTSAISGSFLVDFHPLPGVDLRGRLCICLLRRGTS